MMKFMATAMAGFMVAAVKIRFTAAGSMIGFMAMVTTSFPAEWRAGKLTVMMTNFMVAVVMMKFGVARATILFMATTRKNYTQVMILYTTAVAVIRSTAAEAGILFMETPIKTLFWITDRLPYMAIPYMVATARIQSMVAKAMM